VAPAKHRYAFDNCYHEIGGSANAATTAAQSKGQAQVSPLETVWFIGGLQPQWARSLLAHFSPGGSTGAQQFVLARSLEELPRRIRKVHVYAERRATTKKNKKNRAPKKQKTTKQGGKGDSVVALTAALASASAKAEREAREGPDWECAQCGNVNWGRREQCNRCPTLREGAVGSVLAVHTKKSKKRKQSS
jgi:rubrerythrin